MSTKPNRRAAWQLPDGVSSGTWDYAQADSIADDYDDYFREHGMFSLDEELAARYLDDGKCVIDLGCGTGRALLPLADRISLGVAFDLSQAMLRTVRDKTSLADVPSEARTVAQPGDDVSSESNFLPTSQKVSCVRGNLVDLSCFADSSFDYAMCLFSTLGMIRGSASRSSVVEHVSRMLSQDGIFILQVHNYWAHLFDPEGPLWMIRNLTRAKLRGDVEIGDKFFLYRGIPDMYLHSFSKTELTRLLRQHRFEIEEWLPLNRQQDGRLRWSNVLESTRASGWIVVARKNA